MAESKHRRVELVSFSGIDGSGKSTQIESLRARLELGGLQVEVIRFWDDIARLKRARESTGHAVFKGDKGVGTPSAPINRRDKNVKGWPMTGVRLLLYLVDAISTRQTVRRARRSGADVVIFDRFMFDEFANLNLRNPLIRAYIVLLMNLIPKLDLSYVLDADPIEARARKPEYPLDFLHTNRIAYLELTNVIDGITIIDPMPVEDVNRAVISRALQTLSVTAEQQKSTAKQNDSANSLAS